MTLTISQNFTYTGGKTEWPELLGMKGKEAKAVIQKERPSIDRLFYIPRDVIVTDDYWCNRVRIWVDCTGTCNLHEVENSIVFMVPKIG